MLQLYGLPLTCAVFPHIAGMQHLQSLELDVTSGSANSNEETNLQLPSLTSLVMAARSKQEVALPPLRLDLSSLQQLDLSECELLPSALAVMTGLVSIDLDGCSLLPDAGQSGAVALLQALQKLTCLQRLQLENMPLLVSEQAQHQLYSALTASSHLTALCFTARNQQPLSQGFAQHAFPPGRQLPELQELSIALNYYDVSEQDRWCLDGSDLATWPTSPVPARCCASLMLVVWCAGWTSQGCCCFPRAAITWRLQATHSIMMRLRWWRSSLSSRAWCGTIPRG